MGRRAGLDGTKISPPTGIPSPDRPAFSSVTILTELPGPDNFVGTCYCGTSLVHGVADGDLPLFNNLKVSRFIT